MPMPREEDDDLFHREADVDFDDADEKPKKKTAKKKVAKKKTAAPKKAAASASAPKKTAKKKAKRVVEEVEEEEEEAPAPRKTAKRKPAKVVIDKPVPVKKKAPAKPARPAKTARFGAGLFDDEVEESQEEAPKDPPAKDEVPAVDFQREYTEADEPVEGPGAVAIDDKVDEYGRPEPLANYVVHVYELGRLKRTIDRNFTAEAAEAFATEFSRTSKRYGRSAVAGKKDTQPAKEIA